MKRGFARFQLLFGVIFTLIALVFCFLGAVRPALQRRDAARWQATPCVIAHSSVVRQNNEYSRTRKRVTHSYRLSVAYDYKFQGQPFRGTRYSFDLAGGASFRGTSQVARLLPAGSTTTCWVNPARPSEAVLKRESEQPVWLILVPLALTAAGVATIFNAWKTLGT